VTNRRRMAALACLAGLGVAGAASVGNGPAPARSSERAAAPAALAVAARPAAVTTGSVRLVRTWSVTVPGPIALSSPIPVVIGGTPVVVVGSRDGRLYGIGLPHGAVDRVWVTPYDSPIDSTPSVWGSEIFVGAGNAAKPVNGGYLAVNASGSRRFYRQITRTPTDDIYSGVQAGLTVAHTQGVWSVTAGSLGQEMDSLNASDGAVLRGFPWPSTDSEFSTPAVTNLYGNGQNYIISGAAQTAGYAYHHTYVSGGHIRIIKQTGNAGYSSPIGGAVCDIVTNEAVDSSPAVGPFDNGKVAIVVGTGTEQAGRSDEDTLFAVLPNCHIAWHQRLAGATTSSPALAAALGNGRLQVVEGTSTGWVYVLDPSNGQTDWKTDVGATIIGSVTTASLTGPYQDVLVPTVRGLYILDGRTGQIVATALYTVGLQNSPLVTDDPDGLIGITTAGYNNKNQGEIVHYEVLGSNGRLADEPGAWPMFHHDPQLTGSTLPPLG
jgi:hypothetical protein